MSVTLYADATKLAGEGLQEHLRSNGVETKNYDALIDDDLKDLKKRQLVWVDKGNCNYAVVLAILSNNDGDGSDSKVLIVNKPTPLNLMKSKKNKVSGAAEVYVCHHMTKGEQGVGVGCSKLFIRRVGSVTSYRSDSVSSISSQIASHHNYTHHASFVNSFFQGRVAPISQVSYSRWCSLRHFC